MDATGEDSDVQLQKELGSLFDEFFKSLPGALHEDDGALRPVCSQKQIELLVNLLEPFQESPQLLDPHLPQFLAPLTSAFTTFITSPPSDEDLPPRDYYTLPVAVSRILYTLVKIRGPKIISRFLPNQPFLLEPVSTLFKTPSTGVDVSWELRYILLLWLSHLLLAPFDLSTISTDPPAGVTYDLSILDGTRLDVLELPHLSKRLLALGISYLSSPGNRESDAAALLLVRISLRRDMRSLGLLDAMVVWGISAVGKEEIATEALALFLKTGVMAVLAGFLAQGDSEVVEKFVPEIFKLVTGLQDNEREEWQSAGVRRLGMKIYRWVAVLTLAHPREEDYVEGIIEKLLNALGDRDTAVRFGASKSLAVVARKLDPDMAGDVLEAVMSVYEEDVFFDPPVMKESDQRQRKVLTAVTPERWHGATLTLATFLRQRAVRSTDVMVRVVECIVEALSFEQRRSTFAVGGNVRDAACYAAWSLARSYTTAELQGAGDIVVPATEFDEGRKIIQLIATELVVAGCLDPLGNVRRAASAALQELVGRHSGCVVEGISLVQAVDYNAVALRQRSVISVASAAVALDREYWKGVVFGLADGWRGIGSSDDEGRRIAALSLGNMVCVTYATDDKSSLQKRGHFVLQTVMRRTRTEGNQQIEVYHGCIRALAEIVDRLDPGTLDEEDKRALHQDVFAKLNGKELTNPVLRPELTAEATCRLVRSLPSRLPPKVSSWRLWTAIVEASLERTEAAALDEAIPAAEALLENISLQNRRNLVESWCDRISAPLYRRRGPILALGRVLRGIIPALPSEEAGLNADNVISVLIAAARRSGEVEVRMSGVKALGWGATFPPEVIDIILEALDDYAVDTRGDVGSWVRSEAITAALALFSQSTNTLSDSMKWKFLSKIVRVAVEKLDRLRLRAAEALLAISHLFPALGPINKDVLTASTQDYFSYLLPLLAQPQLREAFLEGYVTSAGAGSDSVLKASRHTLLLYLGSSTPEHRDEVAVALAAVFRRAVDKAEDRVAVPLMEVASLLMDMSLLPLSGGVGKRVFVLTQKAHFKSSNMPKLSAAVRVYRSLALAAEGEVAWAGEVRTKLAKMLLHPFPTVRMEVSEAMFLVAGECGSGVGESMERVDWGKGTKELATVVETIKAALG